MSSVSDRIALIEKWDSDLLMRAHLSILLEPTYEAIMETERALARIILLKSRIRRFTQLREFLAPRRVHELEVALARDLLRRKVLIWQIFPIRELPSEILTEIFRYVVRSFDNISDSMVQRQRLTWVCRQFREVALADGLLWNVVWFNDKAPWNRSLNFFYRAGVAPLDIRIDERPKKTDDIEDPPRFTFGQMNWLLDILLRKMATIRTLVIAVHDELPALAVLDKMRAAGPAPLLERFELYRTGPPYMWTKPLRASELPRLCDPIAICNGYTPKLRWLTLDGIVVDWEHLSFANLTVIDLKRMNMQLCPSTDTFREMLTKSKLTKLVCHAAGPRPDGTDLSRIKPVYLPHLQELHMGDMNLHYACVVVAGFNAPQLKSLTLANFVGSDYSTFFAWIRERFPDIKLLALYSVNLETNPESLGKTVRWLDSLRKLRILKLGNMRPLLLEALLADPREHRFIDPEKPDYAQEPTAVCPALEILKLHFQTPVTMQEVAPMLRLLTGRRAMGAPIRKTYVNKAFVELIKAEQVEALRDVTQVDVYDSHSLTQEEADIIGCSDEAIPRGARLQIMQH
ncbi:uncharacterized protein FIBRA_05244 [Fibroporia radiculosa]|uniref:F-box domain-containing protein n=1 Tax=Fibroporia radiculosa TaxID=599839 RepID=J4G8W2_9APHY|nr:uncharacterized protein FIBRA_05244 [Fibroporia radiculosa]CCM03123.1 predicted protein [Fibroporia radiculosa]